MFSNINIDKLAAPETPYYYYDLSLLQKTLSTCADAANVYNFHVHYAMKANFNVEVLKKIKGTGFGADCVSGGEVRRAIEVGFDKGKILSPRYF